MLKELEAIRKGSMEAEAGREKLRKEKERIEREMVALTENAERCVVVLNQSL